MKNWWILSSERAVDLPLSRVFSIETGNSDFFQGNSGVGGILKFVITNYNFPGGGSAGKTVLSQVRQVPMIYE